MKLRQVFSWSALILLGGSACDVSAGAANSMFSRIVDDGDLLPLVGGVAPVHGQNAG